MSAVNLTTVLIKNPYKNADLGSLYHIFHNEGAKYALTDEQFRTYLRESVRARFAQEFLLGELVGLWFAGIIPPPTKGSGVGVTTFAS